jgi:pyruvate dehydrogenase E1 component alpha subunit
MGLPAVEVDGGDVSKVWEVALSAIERARSGQGPTFLRARCVHLEGHFLGFQLLRVARDPLRKMPEVAVPLAQSFLHPGGAAWQERLAGLKTVIEAVLATIRDRRRDPFQDPLSRARATLQSDAQRLQELEEEVERQISRVLESALGEEPS